MDGGDDDRRRARLAELEHSNRAMLERVRAAGPTLKPASVDKLHHPRGVFNRGRKQTI